MALPFTKAGYTLQKLANRGREYPIATVAFYGPDNQRASKLAVGILKSDASEIEMQKWFAQDQEDLRASNSVLSEALEFIKGHAAKSIALMDDINGCPHEEGIDYPLNERCPKCPYWQGRERPVDRSDSRNFSPGRI